MMTQAKARPPATLARLRRGLVLRANSLLITLYGDCIAPRRQAVWLGSLIELAGLFGLSSRLVRTSASRLTAGDWLSATRSGRKSYYALSASGLLRIEHAQRRVYSQHAAPWNGCFTLVLLRTDSRASVKRQLRQELLWDGFGSIAPGVFAHPDADHQALREILISCKAKDHAAVLTAENLASFTARPLSAIVAQTWRLAEVALAWRAFVQRFEPLHDELAALSDAEAFFARTLLIHEYRRVLLRDPNLPNALLPSDWAGLQAQRLCARLYLDLFVSSEAFVRRTVQTLDGPLAPTPRTVGQRFVSDSGRKH